MPRLSLPLFAVSLLMLGPVQSAQLVPTPRATVIPVSSTNRPFLGAANSLLPVDLAARGYVEDELLVSGSASVYEWAAADGASAVTVRNARIPYATRMLLRRPADPRRFGGRVIVELLNAEGGYDSAPLWGFSWEHFIRNGDIWVGLTVKSVAASALKSFDPVRYAPLALALVPKESCKVEPAAADAAPNEDSGLALDIIAQAGALLRSSSKDNPLLPYRPQRVIAAGYSDSGAFIATYANALHATLRLGDGAPVFDAYVDASGAAKAVPINSCAQPLAGGDPRRAILPRDVPVVVVMTQSDFNRAPEQRRDDSDAPRDLFRWYEVAGSSQSGPYPAGQPAAADLQIAGHGLPADDVCAEPRSDFPLGYAFNAIWRQLDDLLVRRQPMGKVPRIETDSRHAAVLDEWGNVKGGWRLPPIDVPLAAYSGSSSPRDKSARSVQLCALTGSLRRFDSAQFRSLYRDRNEYLRRFNAAVDQAVAERRLVREDATAMKAAASRAAQGL